VAPSCLETLTVKTGGAGKFEGLARKDPEV